MSGGKPGDVPASVAEIAIRAEPAALARSSGWLQESGLQHGVPADQIQRLDLCLHEALANVIDHGGRQAAAAPILLRFGVAHAPPAGAASLTVVDGGPPFDPERLSPKPLPASLEAAEPGGLGLRMIRSFSDALHYRRVGATNELRITVRWVAEA